VGFTLYAGVANFTSICMLGVREISTTHHPQDGVREILPHLDYPPPTAASFHFCDEHPVAQPELG
jgi:hypothetical protein